MHTLSHVDCLVNHPSYSGSFTSYMILVCVSTKGGRISREGAAERGWCGCGKAEKGGFMVMMMMLQLLPFVARKENEREFNYNEVNARQ